MQFAKDTFYMALRERLATVNPARTIMLQGTSQPAMLVVENEAVNSAPDYADCFYLRFGAAKVAKGFAGSVRPLMELACTISYRTAGTTESATDRGRMMGALDGELMRMCEPASAPKLDYAQSVPTGLGTRVFWTRPELGEVIESTAELARTATVTLFFYPEVNA